MNPSVQIVLVACFVALIVAALRMRVLAWLAARPLITFAAASGIGLLFHRLGNTELDAGLLRTLSHYGLGYIAFFAALQCRLSRLSRISGPAFRLAAVAPPVTLILFALFTAVIVPGVGPLAALLAGAAVMMGGAPSLATPLLTAPIAKETKAAVRLEGSAALSIAVPLAVLIEAAATPAVGTSANQGWVSFLANVSGEPIFRALAGFFFGGSFGLIAGRMFPLSAAAPLPATPLVVATFALIAGSLTIMNPVMCAVGAGMLYSEEAPLRSEVRTRLWRVAESLIMPVGFVLLGLACAPILVQINLLIIVAAVVAVVAARGVARFVALRGLGLSSQDHQFLMWFGGAPGIGSSLFLVGLMASSSPLIVEKALATALATFAIGLCLTRAQSRPLTSRLVQATARARKRRYASA